MSDAFWAAALATSSGVPSREAEKTLFQ